MPDTPQVPGSEHLMVYGVNAAEDIVDMLKRKRDSSVASAVYTIESLQARLANAKTALLKGSAGRAVRMDDMIPYGQAVADVVRWCAIAQSDIQNYAVAARIAAPAKDD